MKRIRCPKCENYLSFDETKYNEGQSLVFVCEHCAKQFSIRIGKSKLKETRKNEDPEQDIADAEFGYISVIENVFGYKQLLPLKEGDNIIGRRCVGTVVSTPIDTGDMSMDRRHCIINVKQNKAGELMYTLQDASSLTGTFYMNQLLQEKEKRRMSDGDIVTIGATTFIFYTNKDQ